MKKLILYLSMIMYSIAAHAADDIGEMIMLHWKTGQRFANENQFEKAITEYTAAIEMDEIHRGDRQYDIYNDRGIVNFMLGRYEEALSDFTTVLNRASFSHTLGTVNIARALKRRAEIYKIVHLPDEAEKDRKALHFIQDTMHNMDQLIKQSIISMAPIRNRSFSHSQIHLRQFGFAENRNERVRIILARHSDTSIENHRDACRDSLNEANGHLYDMARESMNGNFGDAAHHGIQAGSCAFDAWEHSREADRMERENNQERDR